jgi:uncharacterized membrane protein YbhN (UPF0104 family)
VRLRLSTLARLAVAVALTWYILRNADLAAIGHALATVSWPPVAAAAALVFVDRVLNAYRSIALLAPIGAARPSTPALVRIFFVSTFIGNTVGTDVTRVWSLAREGVPGSASLASVLLDRLLGVISILLSAVVGLALAPALLEEPAIRWSFVACAAACAAGLALVFSTRVDDQVRRALGRVPSGRVRGIGTRLLDAVQAYRGRHGMLVAVLCASIGVQVLRILQAWLLGVSLDAGAPPGDYFAVVPIILLVMLLPITIYGLGTSQAAFVWCFARATVPVPHETAVAVSILFVALGLVGNLPGALWYVFGDRRAGGVGPRPAAPGRSGPA